MFSKWLNFIGNLREWRRASSTGELDMLESIARFFEVLAFNMRAADILDVLLTTVFLYAIFVWIRDRISRVVGFGIALIGVIYGLAHYLGLYLMLMVFRVGAAVIARQERRLGEFEGRDFEAELREILSTNLRE